VLNTDFAMRGNLVVFFLKSGPCETLMSARANAESQKILSLGDASSSVNLQQVFFKNGETTNRYN